MFHLQLPNPKHAGTHGIIKSQNVESLRWFFFYPLWHYFLEPWLQKAQFLHFIRWKKAPYSISNEFLNCGGEFTTLKRTRGGSHRRCKIFKEGAPAIKGNTNYFCLLFKKNFLSDSKSQGALDKKEFHTVILRSWEEVSNAFIRNKKSWSDNQ